MGNNSCTCDPIERDGDQFVQWVGVYFGACVYTSRDITAFWFGLFNIFLWLFAQAPQLWQNYKTQTVESLSGAFLITWLLGDLTNLLGCILTQQLPTQLYTAIYFMAMDCAMLSQYLYYTFYKKRKRILEDAEYKELGSDDDSRDSALFNPAAEDSRLSTSSSGVSMQEGEFVVVGNGSHQYAFGGIVLLGFGVLGFSYFSTNTANPAGRVLLSDQKLCNASVSLGEAEFYVGNVAAWLSGVLYFTARFPQIYQNYTRKTTEGLSLSMFAMATAANVFYSLSLVIPDTQTFNDNNFWNNVFPYLLGSAGTIITTIPILVQFFLYKANVEVGASKDEEYPEAIIAPTAQRLTKGHHSPTHQSKRMKRPSLPENYDVTAVRIEGSTNRHTPP